MAEPQTVRLRPLETGDAGALRILINQTELEGRRYLPSGFHEDLPLTSRDVDRLVEKWLGAEGEATFAVVASTGGLVGYAGLGWSWDDHCPWLSVVIDPRKWRRGYGSGALEQLLARVFGQTVAHTVSCWLPEWNSEGLAFAERFGFRQGGRVRRAGLRDGKWFDTIPVDLLRPEWLELSRGGVDDAADG